MTQPIDIAYVDIVARDKSLEKLERDIDKAMDKIEKNFQKDLDKIDAAADKAFANIAEDAEDFGEHLSRSFDEISEAAEEAFEDIDEHSERSSRRIRSRFTVLTAHIGDSFDKIAEKIKRGLNSAFEGLGTGLAKIGNIIGQIGGTLGSFAASNPLIVLILLLLPAIIGLAAALSNLIGLVGLLPAALGVLVAAIAPVVVAFQNFGDAVSALAEGDLEKIDEALKKLSPSARAVAKEVAKLLPFLKEFQRAVQEAFFAQVRGSFTQLVSVLPLISENFRLVAASVGFFVREFAKFAASTSSVNALNDLLFATSNIIIKLTGPLLRLFDAIAVSISAALPFVDRIADAFGRALDRFSAFINKAVETGSFDQFIEDAITTVKELIDLLRAVGGFLGTLFQGTEEAGHELLRTLTDIFNRITEFLKSDDGQRGLEAFSKVITGTGDVLLFLVEAGMKFEQGIFAVIDGLKAFAAEVGKIFSQIGTFFSQVPDKFNQFVAFLTTIPSLIGDAISFAVDAVLKSIGIQIGLILFAIQVLPGKIVEFFTSLPDMIVSAITTLGPKVLEFLGNAFNTWKELSIARWEDLIAFFKSIPDRIGALGPTFLNAGKNLIESFMRGFRAVGSFIGDVAGDIVSSVKSFLNRAIDRINSGIASIDAILPGDLARIPRLASGALIRRTPGGILANVGEGKEDEVVSPLSTLEDIIRKAFGGDGSTGMSVNFGPGSISINFSGVIPTEGEARTTGAAVADGIMSRLASRNIRTQLRTM